MRQGQVVIVGAGPAGLTAAWELVHAGFNVTVLERDPKYVGGLARTLVHGGFRFDVGAHRFFSRNPEISEWWRNRLPGDFIRIRRLTRILFRNRLFHYPLRVGDALLKLGPLSASACVLSYFKRRVLPIKPERSFRDWVSNRFGDRLFSLFFKTYTEKVWGLPCEDISADWASQRIKDLSLGRALVDALKGGRLVRTVTDNFEYPRLGSGMLWEKVRDEIVERGGRVLLDRRVVSFDRDSCRIRQIHSETSSGVREVWPTDFCLVSMPLRDCAQCIQPGLDQAAIQAASSLRYRDFILIVLIVNRPKILEDQWIYVHDPNVRVGRIENYNNWGSEMVPEGRLTCLEFEYFCSREDALWQMEDSVAFEFAKRELQALGLAQSCEVLDGCVVRVENAYPVYDHGYKDSVQTIRRAISTIENLQVIGRNGMHKYNNQDHSMMTGILAARNLSGEHHDLWLVNASAEYHETPQSSSDRYAPKPL